jgi:hypothetical protein
MSIPMSHSAGSHLRVKEILAFIANVVFGRELNIIFKNLACNVSFVIPGVLSPQISVSKNEINDWTTYSAGDHRIQRNARGPIVRLLRCENITAG